MVTPIKIEEKYRIEIGDRLFEPVFTLLIILTSISHGINSQVNPGTLVEGSHDMRLQPKFYPGIIMPTGKVLEYAIAGRRPPAIELGILNAAETSKPMVGPVETSTGFGTVMRTIGQPIFLMFFERYNVWLTDNLKDAVNWPGTLNFARVVRNAIAHGKITIRNPSAPPVSWRGLTYAYSDNGRDIITNDIGIGDMVGLMLDTNNALNVLGVPVL